MGARVHSSPFPPSWAPEAGSDTTHPFDNERASESRLSATAPTVAVLVADGTLRDTLSIWVQGAGQIVGGADLISVAVVVITDARAGARAAVGALRARTRSDAAIIVVLDASASAAEIDGGLRGGGRALPSSTW